SDRDACCRRGVARAMRVASFSKAGCSMGRFVYDRDATVEMDDRTLAHLQVVIINKLRRQESFALTLRDDQRTLSVWVCPQTAVQFVYSGNRQPTLQRSSSEELASV